MIQSVSVSRVHQRDPSSRCRMLSPLQPEYLVSRHNSLGIEAKNLALGCLRSTEPNSAWKCVPFGHTWSTESDSSPRCVHVYCKWSIWVGPLQLRVCSWRCPCRQRSTCGHQHVLRFFLCGWPSKVSESRHWNPGPQALSSKPNLPSTWLVSF